NLFGRDWAVIAEDNNDVIGMYTASVMPVHLNGKPTNLGYLGGLRVNPQHRRRIRYLREGYASIGRFAPEPVPWWFTVVAAEDEPAKRLDFYICGDSVAALWDQRAFKQIVARRYRKPKLVPLYNAYARAMRRIPLPREGAALEQTFIAFLAMPSDYALLQDLL